MKLPQSFESLARNEEDILVLQRLLRKSLLYKGEIDGIWGEMTDAAMKKASEKLWLNTYQTKIVGATFISKLTSYAEEVSQKAKENPQALTLVDFQDAARRLDVSVAHVRAVVAVEAAGSGFLQDGRPKILFEAHHFSRYTGRKYDRTHPNISSRRWNRRLYFGGAREYARLGQAIRLNRKAALLSHSIGAFQIMGFNFRYCGCQDVESFVKKNQTAKGQLDCFVNFILVKGLDSYLRSYDWKSFAYHYNGSQYYKNAYDKKLARAFQRYYTT